jgi:dipeptidyl-peptidase 4
VGDNDTVQANRLVAGYLQGRLLHSAFLMVDALIKANRDFDLIVFAHARHGFGAANDYMMRRRRDCFDQHLMGAEPPREYRIDG